MGTHPLQSLIRQTAQELALEIGYTTYFHPIQSRVAILDIQALESSL